jgi:rare lipoprotein A
MSSLAGTMLPGMAVVLLLSTPALADPAISAPTPHIQDTHSRPAHAPAAHSPAVHRVAAKQKIAHPAASETAPADEQAAFYADSNLVWRQTGIASWYGGARWNGKRTASGARYNQNFLTAAHATLPIGTRVRVTLEGSDRSVVVVINDRPGTRRRIIDLSRAAAAALGILHDGVAVVSLTRM